MSFSQLSMMKMNNFQSSKTEAIRSSPKDTILRKPFLYENIAVIWKKNVFVMIEFYISITLMAAECQMSAAKNVGSQPFLYENIAVIWKKNVFVMIEFYIIIVLMAAEGQMSAAGNVGSLWELSVNAGKHKKVI